LYGILFHRIVVFVSFSKSKFISDETPKFY
jgi:hypothetical protein